MWNPLLLKKLLYRAQITSVGVTVQLVSELLFILPLSWVKILLLPVLSIATAYHPVFPPLESAGKVTYIQAFFSLSN